MTRARTLIWILLFGSSAGACDRDGTQGPIEAGQTSDAGQTGDAGRIADASERDAPALGEPAVGNVVFDPMRVSKIEIEVGESDRQILHTQGEQRINSDEDDSNYVVANLRFDGELYEMVGLRVKGNSSRRAAAGNPDAMPYKLDMNKFVAGQTLDGLTKINLHRNAGLNEYLSYGAFRKAGIAASRTGWADIYLNGVSLGLYTLVEQVNERMLEHFYDDKDGELYKPEAPAGYLNYSGENIAAYGDLGYKADKETDHATFLKLVRTINQEPVEAWDEVIDTVSVLEYLAGNVALGNWDTYVAMGHNYYLFEDSPGHMAMLPWDLNLSQGASGVVCPTDIRMGGGPGGEGNMLPDGAMQPGGMQPGGFMGMDGRMPPGGAMGMNGRMPPGGAMPPEGGALPEGGRGGFGRGATPLYTRLMESHDGFTRYTAALQEFLEGTGSAEALNSEIDAVEPVLGERLSAESVQTMRSNIAARIAAIETALATTTECAPETTAAMAE
jgi:spore coat protein CotH